MRRAQTVAATSRRSTGEDLADQASTPGPGSPQSAELLRLQHSAGNRAVVGLIQRAFEGDGAAGAQQGTPVELPAGGGTPAPLGVNEFGEIDGGIESGTVPRLFKNKGKRGVGLVNWAGGSGGAGEQGVGSITLVAPVYDSAAPAKAGKSALAWVRSGSGKATVIRSYKGVQKGANATYWFTNRACARADVHERLHVSSSKSIHDADIKPMEKRANKHKGKGNALASGATAADAVTALQALIDWNTAVTAFSTADTTANTPMGTTDTTDMASPTFIRDYGPRTVKGTPYAHYIDTPPRTLTKTGARRCDWSLSALPTTPTCRGW